MGSILILIYALACNVSTTLRISLILIPDSLVVICNLYCCGAMSHLQSPNVSRFVSCSNSHSVLELTHTNETPLTFILCICAQYCINLFMAIPLLTRDTLLFLSLCVYKTSLTSASCMRIVLLSIALITNSSSLLT